MSKMYRFVMKEPIPHSGYPCSVRESGPMVNCFTELITNRYFRRNLSNTLKEYFDKLEMAMYEQHLNFITQWLDDTSRFPIEERPHKP